MNKLKDIRTLLNDFLSSFTPEDETRVLEQEKKLEEKNRLNH